MVLEQFYNLVRQLASRLVPKIVVAVLVTLGPWPNATVKQPKNRLLKRSVNPESDVFNKNLVTTPIKRIHKTFQVLCKRFCKLLGCCSHKNRPFVSESERLMSFGLSLEQLYDTSKNIRSQEKIRSLNILFLVQSDPENALAGYYLYFTIQFKNQFLLFCTTNIIIKQVRIFWKIPTWCIFRIVEIIV